MSNQTSESSSHTPVFGLLMLTLMVLIALANLVSVYFAGGRQGLSREALSSEAVDYAIRPVAGFDLKAAATGPVAARSGEAVYKAPCVVCHGTGVAGAPKVGDSAAWAPRIKTGFEALVTSALKGKGAMAPQGGGDYSDIEVARAVAYMANAAGASFKEPADAAGGAKAEGKAE